MDTDFKERNAVQIVEIYEHFQEDSYVVAPSLIGRVLVRRFSQKLIQRFYIVETEAYMQDDPASHSYKGVSVRNSPMFGPGGTCYVYLIYGIYFCLNIVTGPEGSGQAVLIRALSPDISNSKCLTKSDYRLYSGPGKICRELRIDRSFNGQYLRSSSNIWVEESDYPLDLKVQATSRIGISRATDRKWRWLWQGHPSVSKPAIFNNPNRF